MTIPPVHHLKRSARQLARREGIPLHAALDRIASSQGYARWSLLAARQTGAATARALYARLKPGELLLIGARPGEGKTLLALELSLEAIRHGQRAVFFSLEYTQRDIVDRLRRLGADPASLNTLLTFDGSEDICADYVTTALAQTETGTLVVIDYLQLLDQRRERPPLDAQVSALRIFARQHGATIAFVSQIDRTYNPKQKPVPDWTDIRLPNPLDLSLFDRGCFLQGGQVSITHPNRPPAG